MGAWLKEDWIDRWCQLLALSGSLGTEAERLLDHRSRMELCDSTVQAVRLVRSNEINEILELAGLWTVEYRNRRSPKTTGVRLSSTIILFIAIASEFGWGRRLEAGAEGRISGGAGVWCAIAGLL